jgi:hypothetical protein
LKERSFAKIFNMAEIKRIPRTEVELKKTITDKLSVIEQFESDANNFHRKIASAFAEFETRIKQYKKALKS